MIFIAFCSSVAVLRPKKLGKMHSFCNLGRHCGAFTSEETNYDQPIKAELHKTYSNDVQANELLAFKLKFPLCSEMLVVVHIEDLRVKHSFLP